MKIKYWIYAFVLLFIGLWISGCAKRPIPTNIIGPVDSKERLLIVTQDSTFKDTVVSNIISEFEKEKVFIEVIDLTRLPDKSTRDYGAIVIMNDYKFFRMNNDVTAFMQRVDDNEKRKIVLLTTAGSPTLVKDDLDVDAFTSASKMIQADAVSEMIIKKINRIILDNK